jgi:transglutaminase-like putative cysteine protease
MKKWLQPNALWTGALSIFLPLAAAWAGEAAPAASAERYVRYGFTMQNPTDQLVPEAELWVCAPLKETSAQRLLHLKVSPPHEERTDKLGNCLLRFVFSNVPPYAVRIATVEATLALSAEPGPIAAEPGRWLKSGPLFEYEDEAFGRLAPEFPVGASEQTARAIYDWVRGHLQDAGYDGTDRGALYALTQKKGDCTEYAALFVALCRRAGIPARAMGGYVATQNAILDPASFHNWAEYHLDGRWHLADPHAGAFNEKADQYVATRVLGESDSPLGNFARFRCLGEDLKVEMNK